MSTCSICPLLCEATRVDFNDCSRFQRHAAAWEEFNRNRSESESLSQAKSQPRAGAKSITSSLRKTLPQIDGRVVSIEEAIEAARVLLKKSMQNEPCRVWVTGRVSSVEGARAAIRLAAHADAILDFEDSQAAFDLVQAVQRSGSMSASLAEVRFRSDCLVFVGDDRLFQRYPKLLEQLASTSSLPERQGDEEGSTSSQRKVVFWGDFSAESVESARRLGFEAFAVECDLAKVAAGFRQWSRIASEVSRTSLNKASAWMASSHHLAVLFAASDLDVPQRDLWIESLLETVMELNHHRRCVAVPLGGDTVTAQQVTTWISGFPGRVRHSNQRFEYDPDRFAREKSKSNAGGQELVLRLSDVLVPADEVSPSLLGPASGIRNEIRIAPELDTDRMKEAGVVLLPRVFLPCNVAGLDHAATFFRLDGTAAVYVDPSDLRRESGFSLAELVERISWGEPC